MILGKKGFCTYAQQLTHSAIVGMKVRTLYLAIKCVVVIIKFQCGSQKWLQSRMDEWRFNPKRKWRTLNGTLPVRHEIGCSQLGPNLSTFHINLIILNNVLHDRIY